jgi:hypothetical protein
VVVDDDGVLADGDALAGQADHPPDVVDGGAVLLQAEDDHVAAADVLDLLVGSFGDPEAALGGEVGNMPSWGMV